MIKIIPGHPHHSFAAAAAAGAGAAFVPFIIPYVIKSQSNARCMRSNVTISRIVLYQIRGPANTTGHGSQTPTQMLCRQLRIVSFTQFALPTVAIAPVPSISRTYSSIDTKYGCAHSSYKNLRFAFSSSVNAGGVSR